MNETPKSKRPLEILLYTFLFFVVLLLSLTFLYYAPQLYGRRDSPLSSRINKSYLVWTGREVVYDVTNSCIALAPDMSAKEEVKARKQIRIREQQEIMKQRKERLTIRYKGKRIWKILTGG